MCKVYTPLALDSELFDIAVARIDTPELSLDALSSTLEQLKKEGMSLVYWTSQSKMSKHAIARLGGELRDYKTTFTCDPSLAYTPSLAALLKKTVVSYQPIFPYEPIEHWATDIGHFSRFGTDPRIPKKHVDSMFRTWMHNSLFENEADEVLLAIDEGCPVGAATLRIRDDIAELVLLAVDPSKRRQGIGTRLVRAAQLWTEQRGPRVLQVTTQRANEPACQLYASCGFQMKQVVYVYHFWLT